MSTKTEENEMPEPTFTFKITVADDPDATSCETEVPLSSVVYRCMELPGLETLLTRDDFHGISWMIGLTRVEITLTA